VAIWYSGSLYILQVSESFCYSRPLCLLQVTGLQFGIADPIIYCTIQFANWCSGPLYVLQLTVLQFGIAERFIYGRFMLQFFL
jgi:hypothetical protein